MLRGHVPDERADVYSFGVLLYEVMARRVPYAGCDTNQVVIGVITALLPRPLLEPAEQARRAPHATPRPII